ncbi:hypothetical protein [Enterobacter soli]|uniref:Acb2/Tad1 domain-containing protein n=1 Tax=Enterobacter soli TaxID=885040 RepID=UPI002F40FB17
MENQHRQIKKQRELNAAELGLMNESKEHEQIVLDFIERLKKCHSENTVEIDMRWLSIGLTNIEQGFMALTRSVAKPGK